jgi:hypothetical protein
MLHEFCYTVSRAAAATATLLFIAAEAALRGLSHDAHGAAQVERAASREVAEEVSVVTAQVRRCAPLLVTDEHDSVRAARCHVAEKGRTEVLSLRPASKS